MKICPACNSKNESAEEYCLTCGQRLIENDDKEEVLSNKLPIPKDDGSCNLSFSGLKTAVTQERFKI